MTAGRAAFDSRPQTTQVDYSTSPRGSSPARDEDLFRKWTGLSAETMDPDAPNLWRKEKVHTLPMKRLNKSWKPPSSREAASMVSWTLDHSGNRLSPRTGSGSAYRSTAVSPARKAP